MLPSGVVLLHNSERSHTAARTRSLLELFNWELFDHSPYRPDLPLSNYRLFTYLKSWLGLQRFNNNEELMEDVKTWLTSQAADFFDTVIQNLFPDTTRVSILAVITLRNSLSMYVFFVYNNFFSLLALLTHRSLRSKQPSFYSSIRFERQRKMRTRNFLG
jgi:hypothetical protein